MEARAQVDEAAQNADPYVRTERRQYLKSNLEAARELLDGLERDHPDATALHTFDGGEEAEVDVSTVRVWEYNVEAEVMIYCYEDHAAARQIVERAIAINPESASHHGMHAAICGQLKDFPAAIASIERAISLEPDNLGYKRVLNDIRQEEARVAAEQAAADKPSRWKSWLG
ncbi:hypothetical protein JDN40_04215 [Rhodomicrobium vannielii ATCC 17100]|uniref:hypothetical protein n=1 Tax=Rhodomicrobium vannielii TaxID=1069 RepID=UPI00191AD48C|nr:hypothetical protein [Rhodomicrobium vannielii]MBJ7533312.1 hypothetical protein [Rhodomicrobium vannielii ATCC 17100]